LSGLGAGIEGRCISGEDAAGRGIGGISNKSPLPEGEG